MVGTQLAGGTTSLLFLLYPYRLNFVFSYLSKIARSSSVNTILCKIFEITVLCSICFDINMYLIKFSFNKKRERFGMCEQTC